VLAQKSYIQIRQRPSLILLIHEYESLLIAGGIVIYISVVEFKGCNDICWIIIDKMKIENDFKLANNHDPSTFFSMHSMHDNTFTKRIASSHQNDILNVY